MKALSALIILWMVATTLVPASGAAKPVEDFGPLLDADLQISPGEVRGTGNALAFDGERFLVVWEQPSDSQIDIYGCFVDLLGNMGEPFPIVSKPNNQYNPAVAFNGAHYLVAWNDNFGTLPGDTVSGRAVSPQGELLGEEVVLSSFPQLESAYLGSVATNGEGFMVTWEGTPLDATVNGGVGFCMFSLDETYTPTPGICWMGNYPARQWWPSAAFGTTHFLFAHNINDNEITDIQATIVSADGGTLTGEFPITTAPDYQYQYPPGSIAFGREVFLITWEDHRTDELEIFAARVTEQGQLLDGPPESGGILVSTEAGLGGPHAPRTASSGDNWLVVWAGPETMGARVDESGTVLDPVGIDLSRMDLPQFHSNVALGGSLFLVTWIGEEQPGGPRKLYGQLVGEAAPFKLDLLISKVEDMIADGHIQEREGAHLLGLLRMAEYQLDEGHDRLAERLLRTFTYVVMFYYKTGKISAEDGMELIRDAREIIRLIH